MSGLSSWQEVNWVADSTLSGMFVNDNQYPHFEVCCPEVPWTL